MNAKRIFYSHIPKLIHIPEEYVDKEGEIIILIEPIKEVQSNIKDLYGSIPDFPDRDTQRDYEKRDSL